MEVFVYNPFSQFFSALFPLESHVQDLVEHYINKRGYLLEDFYIKKNGRLSGLDDKLQDGAVYRLEPRLCGGKGGFGSMLRALGAQIEKTTNREACRDLSGRRLRDVNHEKEMAEWLKKQVDRDAEKEQRRLERLQRKLAEPKHQFTDPKYERQCHDLSERLEDSVLKGMQASSSGLVKVEEAPSRKRPTPNKGRKATKKKCLWTGASGLDDLNDSSEEDESTDSEASASTSSSSPEAPGSPAKKDDRAETEVPYSAAQGKSDAKETNSGSRPLSSERSPAHVQACGVAGCGAEQEAEPGCRGEEEQQPVDLEAVGSVKALEALGLEKLKAELMRQGLKCGGTLAERAARLFSTKGLNPEQIDPALLAKPSKGKKK
ncbi:replication stress response regulator SDE2 isoform X2 [Hypomesus transpacificus]|uniref:replication stress response regulator SDE2 isoform X2 n=1 Tax=Hypomesus transpacificus TaxID=137520 RepID=UPI001F079D8A|nr:replication stress response regulator SDE2 isoform X2 [Hypomesus transpacificus]